MKKNYPKIMLLFIALSLFGTSGFSQNVGNTAPDFEVDLIEGGSFKLSDHRGQVVFIFLFGNSCTHCIANAPNTQSGIYGNLQNNSNFKAVGIDVWDGSRNSVVNFGNRTGVEYPLGLDGSSILSAYQTTYDRILVVDAEGILVYKSSANASTSVVSAAKAAIDSALGNITSISKKKEQNEKIIAYPNPASEKLFIQNPYSNAQKVYLQITTATGQTVIREQHFGNQNSIELAVSHLPKGYYFLKINDGKNANSFTKILIE